MPYTPTIRASRVTDDTINADYGTVQASTGTDALDHIARKMGWKSYDEYAAAAANHNGVRTLTATQIAS